MLLSSAEVDSFEVRSGLGWGRTDKLYEAMAGRLDAGSDCDESELRSTICHLICCDTSFT